MRYILPILTLLISFSANAQIISDDTVCISKTATFDANLKEIDHTWIMDTTDISPYNNTIATASPAFTSISNPTFSTMTYDNGSWYSFVTNYGNKDITRLDYGTNPLSTPTATNLGNFSFSGFQMEGVQIIKDSATGNWYGFFVCRENMMRLDFGTSLSNNTPTATFYNFNGTFAWPHQIGIAKFGAEWVGFVANRSGVITRLDFGTSLTNSPTATNLPKVGSYNNPCNFALHFQGTNWYMLVTSLIDNRVTRLNFGPNIKNNNPAGTLLGGVFLDLPRTIAIFSDCNQLIAYVSNETGSMIKLDFNNDITTIPTYTNMGSLGVTQINSFVPFIHNGTQYIHIISAGSKSYFTKTLFNYPAPNSTVYYNPAFTYQFTSPGSHPVTLLQNTGSFMGMSSYCKNIYATIPQQNIIEDTSICQGDSVILDATTSGATTYNWTTGETTPTITVKQSGTYGVVISGGSNICTSADSAKVTVNDYPNVDLDSFIEVCNGVEITLRNKNTNPAGATYTWSSGATTPTYKFTGNPALSGNYWLEVNNNGCKDADTVSVNVNPTPIVYIGEDTIVCSGKSFKLDAGAQPSGSVYQWSTGSTDRTIEISQTGNYWVMVTNKFNCTTIDSIDFRAVDAPPINIGNDTTLCYGEALTLYAPITSIPVRYVWSDASEGDRLVVTKPDIYTLYAFSECGLTRDDIRVDFYNCDIWFPSAFTPNADGRNDIARVRGNIAEIQNFELHIFDRWGKRVFQTNDVNMGWDGAKSDIATYYYMIKYTFDGDEKMLKGDITLLR